MRRSGEQICIIPLITDKSGLGVNSAFVEEKTAAEYENYSLYIVNNVTSNDLEPTQVNIKHNQTNVYWGAS